MLSLPLWADAGAGWNGIDVNGLLAAEPPSLPDSAVPALPLPIDAASLADGIFRLLAASFLLDAEAGAFITPAGSDDILAACDCS